MLDVIFIDFPPSFFSSHTLTSLELSLGTGALFPNSLNFPAITDLSLHKFTFCVSNDGCANPFSALNKLISLVLESCIVRDEQKLSISSATLTYLTILNLWVGFKFELSTPSLSNFVVYCGAPLQKLCGSTCNLPSIKHVNIIIHGRRELNSADTPLVLFNWLIELANIESLMVCLDTLKVLYKMFLLRKFQ